MDSHPYHPLCREALSCSNLHPSGRFSSPFGRSLVFNQASGFLSKTQIWEDCCNCPDDVDFRPDALIHKASIAIQIQMPERQSSWSGCACIKYGNCVHHISHPDDHPSRSGHAKPLYGNYLQRTCDRPDEKATLS